MEFPVLSKVISRRMFTKPSKFRDSETVPHPTQMSQKLSARTSEVASPVQFLSDSDATEEMHHPIALTMLEQVCILKKNKTSLIRL